MESSFTLNLSEPITRDDYFSSVARLTEFFRELADRTEWCSARHRYFAAIVPEYNAYARDNYDPALVPDDADYAARLRDMRARVLWYVSAETIDLDTANEGFRAAGWPLYAVEKAGVRVEVCLPPLYVNVAPDGELPGNTVRWVRDHIGQLIIDRLDGKRVRDNRYVPGSATISGNVEVYFVSAERSGIPESDTLRPSYV